MPSIPRVFIDYACYHIITRGNQKQKVFIQEEDYLKYVSILKKAKRKYKINLYSYCLMPNHVHLLVAPEKAPTISGFMHWLSLGYTVYFNSKYGKKGHLWQGRFKGKPILKGDYLIQCAAYIEGNPVRAKLVTDMAAYKWSSYRERCLYSGKFILDELRVQV
ncbi:MAG: transposase [Candidatus Omnitrophica bacterium]|nr:transposase [Candidatus Omnitrophota bacterium]